MTSSEIIKPCVVLVQTHNPGNIGAVARTMMNFGFDDLRLVLPQCDPLCKASKDRARIATPLIENAKLAMTVAQATVDCHLVWATSGNMRGASPDVLSPASAALAWGPLKHQSRIALVFGPEDRGLNNDEIRPCDALISIPTREEFPSMNLSHAVGIVLYEIAKQHGIVDDLPAREHPLASGKLKEGLYAHLQETLLEINFLDPLNPERIMRDLRNVLGRAQLDEREITILRGICRQIVNFRKNKIC